MSQIFTKLQTWLAVSVEQFRQRPWLFVLQLVVAIQLIGAAIPMVWYDGSSVFKYVDSQVNAAQNYDVLLERHTAFTVFGEGEPLTAEELALIQSLDEHADYVWTERLSVIDTSLGIALLIAVVLVLIRPSPWVLIPVAIWFFLLPLANALNGGAGYSELDPFGHAVRYVSPVILWLLWRKKDMHISTDTMNLAPSRMAEHMMRVAIAATFLIHGYKAFVGHAPFADLLFSTFNRVDIQIGTDLVTWSLWTIGIMDICLAVALLCARVRVCLLWMVCWGLLTAWSRVTASGWEMFAQTLVRAANGGLPLALLLIWVKQGHQVWPQWVWMRSQVKSSTQKY